MRALAKHVGLSGTRVSQLLSVLDLHEDILAAIDAPDEEAPKVAEKDLRGIARLAKEKQVREWRKLSER